MTRIVLRIVLILIPVLANGQDPTIPSKDIVARLKVEQPAAETLKAEPTPNFKLRAIVLANPAKGTAILEADGRRFRISLDRAATEMRKTNINLVSTTADVQIRRNNFYVVDFSETSIVLSDGVTKFFVQ